METKNEEVNEEEEGEPTLEPVGVKKEEKKEEKVLSPNERAEANVAAMKVENERLEKNLLALQEVKATEMLSGSANAGQAPEAKGEMSDEDYAKAVQAGEKPDVKE